MSYLDFITRGLIHKSGYNLIVSFFIINILLGIFSLLVGILFAPITLYIIYFFRNPRRVVPALVDNIVSPADGVITYIDNELPPEEIGHYYDKYIRVSVFLSVFDVHVNRSPVSGTVVKSVYREGFFVDASRHMSCDFNERRTTVISSEFNKKNVIMVQIAGMIARRILFDKKVDDKVALGDEVGIIKFGSRIDLYFPDGSIDLRVRKGQRMIAGETVIAKMLK